jgi:hypothetical protein
MNMDAFGGGQIGSKIWLAEELEKLVSPTKKHNIWILGGWYGLLPFILKTRDRIKTGDICSFDIDQRANQISERVNDLWLWKDENYQAIPENVNHLKYRDYKAYNSGKPHVVINTSTEHMVENDWFLHIPRGTRVVLQSCNLKIQEHVNTCESVEEFKEKYPLQVLEFWGEHYFEYDSPHDYSRFMMIGIK